MAAGNGRGNKSNGGTDGSGEDASPLTASVIGYGLPLSLEDFVAQTAEDEFDPGGGAGDDRMVLSLGDLLPDANGEVVLSTEAGALAISILTDSAVTETGTAESHVTSTGVDVTGYQYCTFSAGLTLYYPPEIELLITSQNG